MKIRIVDEENTVLWTGKIEELLSSFLGARRLVVRENEDLMASDRDALVRRAFLARQSRAAQMMGLSVSKFVETYGNIDRCPPGVDVPFPDRKRRQPNWKVEG